MKELHHTLAPPGPPGRKPNNQGPPPGPGQERSAVSTACRRRGTRSGLRDWRRTGVDAEKEFEAGGAMALEFSRSP